MTDDEFEVDPEDWEDAVAKTERAAEVLDAVIAHLETCEWTVELTDVRPPIEALGIKPRKVMPLLYTAVEGHRAGSAAVRRDLPPRAGTDVSPGSSPPATASDRLPKTAQAKIGSPIRGWCNR